MGIDMSDKWYLSQIGANQDDYVGKVISNAKLARHQNIDYLQLNFEDGSLVANVGIWKYKATSRLLPMLSFLI